MANRIKNSGVWGPIDEGGQKSFHGKQIVIDFDNSETTSIMYTGNFECPISTETEFIWNTEAVDCATATDMEIFWQGTDDPSAAMAHVSGEDVSAADTGWTSVVIKDMTGSEACDAREVINLSGVANVVNKTYMRIKFILTAANPGDVDITCRLVNIPSIHKVTHSIAL